MNRQYQIKGNTFTLYETEKEFQRDNIDNLSIQSLKRKFSLEFFEREYHHNNKLINKERLIIQGDTDLFKRIVGSLRREERNAYLIDFLIQRKPVMLDQSVLKYLKAVAPSKYEAVNSIEFPLSFHGEKTGRWTKNKKSQLDLHGLQKYTMEQEMDEPIDLIHDIDDPTQSVPLLGLTLAQSFQLERGLIVARPGHHFVMANWSSIELFILSYLLNEKNAIQMLETDGLDFYSQFGLPHSVAKKLLISFMYGKSCDNLKNNLKDSYTEKQFEYAYEKCQQIFTNRKEVLKEIDNLIKGTKKHSSLIIVFP